LRVLRSRHGRHQASENHSGAMDDHDLTPYAGRPFLPLAAVRSRTSVASTAHRSSGGFTFRNAAYSSPSYTTFIAAAAMIGAPSASVCIAVPANIGATA